MFPLVNTLIFPLEFPPNGELVAGLPQLWGGVEGDEGGEQVVHGYILSSFDPCQAALDPLERCVIHWW